MSSSLVGVDLVDAQEAVDLVAVGEVQAVPVDDRAAAQQVPDRRQVGEREVLVPQPAPRALPVVTPGAAGVGGRRCVVGGAGHVGAPAARRSAAVESPTV